MSRALQHDDSPHRGPVPPSRFRRRATPLPAVLSLVALCTLLAHCERRRVPEPPVLPHAVVATHPHDPRAFTQGLIVAPPILFESTGRYGSSSVRRVDIETGAVLDIHHLPDHLFGEGLALLDGRLYQLEWTTGVGRIYDPETLKRIGQFRYEGEGWGLTTDGSHLIMSDGSSRLRFLDPGDFSVIRELSVRDHRGEVTELNELEYVDGQIFANLWHRDVIVRIHPRTGFVTGTLHVGALERPRPRDEQAVANGIAHDPETGLLYVTGKLWRNLYVLRLGNASPTP